MYGGFNKIICGAVGMVYTYMRVTVLRYIKRTLKINRITFQYIFVPDLRCDLKSISIVCLVREQCLFSTACAINSVTVQGGVEKIRRKTKVRTARTCTAL